MDCGSGWQADSSHIPYPLCFHLGCWSEIGPGFANNLGIVHLINLIVEANFGDIARALNIDIED